MSASNDVNRRMTKNTFRQFVYDAIEHFIPYGRFGDKIFAYYLFYRCHGRLPINEMRFNDVLFRFKVSDQILDPACTFTTDKEFVKLYVKSILGEKYNVPTLAILHTEEEINNYDFPSNCVLKPTHSSQRVIVRKNGSEIDYDKCREWLSHNYYYASREANYRYLSPKIIVEPLLYNGVLVTDYKIFCFNGQAKCILFLSDRFGENASKTLFDTEWNPIPIQYDSHPSDTTAEKPHNLPEMIEAAEKLSGQFDFVRVDLYSGEDHIYVGELTHCHMSAMKRFSSEEDEILLSEIIFG